MPPTWAPTNNSELVPPLHGVETSRGAHEEDLLYLANISSLCLDKLISERDEVGNLALYTEHY
jgi:hypothetical protein